MVVVEPFREEVDCCDREVVMMLEVDDEGGRVEDEESSFEIRALRRVGTTATSREPGPPPPPPREVLSPPGTPRTTRRDGFVESSTDVLEVLEEACVWPRARLTPGMAAIGAEVVVGGVKRESDVEAWALLAWGACWEG